MERRLWKNIAWFLLISNTLGILVLIETILFKIPFITLFIVTLGIVLYANLKLFKVNNLFGKKIF